MTIRKAARTLAGALLIAATPLVAFASAGGSPVGPNAAPAPVPEPGALVLFAAGAVVVCAAIRRSRNS